MSPYGVLRRRPALALLLAGVAVVLAITARVDSSWLLKVDRPLTTWLADERVHLLSSIVAGITFLGSATAILVGGSTLAVLAWFRCRVVAVLVVVALLARPVVEVLLKQVIDRPRPDLGRVVASDGPSFPSGHVLAAATLWCLVPLVLSLYVRSRRIWWIAHTLSIAMVVSIGMSRVYLGVHWGTDVVAGFVIALLLLAALDYGYRVAHRGRCCALHRREPADGPTTSSHLCACGRQ